jgi:hypothetical protein
MEEILPGPVVTTYEVSPVAGTKVSKVAALRGDMLIKLNGTNETRRVQCPWVSEEEVQAVTDFLRSQGEPVYDENILKPRDDEAAEDDDDGETDPMYDAAVQIVSETRRCSTSWLACARPAGWTRPSGGLDVGRRRRLRTGRSREKYLRRRGLLDEGEDDVAEDTDASERAGLTRLSTTSGSGRRATSCRTQGSSSIPISPQLRRR